MDSGSPILAITTNDGERDFYNQLAVALGYPFANIIIGSPANAAQILSTNNYSPRYLIVDIGDRGQDVLSEIDSLAEQCEMGSRVVVLGNTNDISFYRDLMSRGVTEYLNHPTEIESIRSVLFDISDDTDGYNGSIISFMGAASGDGSSMLACNVAYALSQQGDSVVLVDMDYQFGMVAKNFDLAAQYGIKDIFDHPERGIDSTLLGRMVVQYSDNLGVIAAPNSLQFMPQVSAEQIRELIHALRQKYKYVILDLPHIWNHWIASIIPASDQVVLVGQLWLKSVTHCSRLLTALRQIGVNDNQVSIVINRSGAKFKEGVNPKDFERVTNNRIFFYMSNDIKTVVRAENHGTTIIEQGNSSLANQLLQLSEDLVAKLKSQKNKDDSVPQLQQTSSQQSS